MVKTSDFALCQSPIPALREGECLVRVLTRLKEFCPQGINLFFDNVGGQVLEAGLALLAQRGCIVLCGGILRYNEEQPSPGPRNYLTLVIQRGRSLRKDVASAARVKYDRFVQGQLDQRGDLR